MSGAAQAIAANCLSPTGVLVVSSVHEDHEAIHRILRRTHRTFTAGSCHQAQERLSRGGVAIVLSDYHLPDGTWLDILSLTSTDAVPPLLIVATWNVDLRLWAEVLNLGGFDVIAKPFDAREVEHVVKTAWACRCDSSHRKQLPGSGVRYSIT